MNANRHRGTVGPRRQQMEIIAQRKAEEEKEIRETERGHGMREIWRQICYRGKKWETDKKEKLLFCGCCWGCLRHDTVPTALQWEKTPRVTTKDTRGAGSWPCRADRPGDSSTQTHAQHCTQSSCCHNNPPCTSLIGTACLARQQQGLRRDTQKVTQQTSTHIAGDWLWLTQF